MSTEPTAFTQQCQTFAGKIQEIANLMDPASGVNINGATQIVAGVAALVAGLSARLDWEVEKRVSNDLAIFELLKIQNEMRAGHDSSASKMLDGLLDRMANR